MFSVFARFWAKNVDFVVVLSSSVVFRWYERNSSLLLPSLIVVVLVLGRFPGDSTHKR
jgi:hypothetical protein